MAINDPRARAHKVSTKAQARRLWDQLDAERDDRQLDPDWLADADAAQAHLEEQHLSKDMDPSPADDDNASGDDSAPAAKPRGKRSPKSSGKRPGGTRAGGRSGGRRPGRGAGGRVRDVAGNLPGFSASGPFVITILWGTLALVVLYVLVRSAEVLPKGKSPLDLFATGLTTGLHTLIAPVDPLAPRATRQAAGVSSAADVRQVLVGGVPLASSSPTARRPTQSTTQ